MSLLVAMSLFDIEQELFLSNECDFLNGGACLLKLLQSHASDSFVNRQEFLDLTTPLLVEDSDEIYEYLTAATPKRFSNMVKTSNVSSFTKKQNPLHLPMGGALRIIYQGRDLLDLAGNLQQKELVQPSRVSAVQLNRGLLPKPVLCTNQDCHFMLYPFD